MINNLQQIVEAALQEDLGIQGDITSKAVLSPRQRAHGMIIAKQNGVVAGLVCAEQTFRHLDPDCSFGKFIADGGKVSSGDKIAVIEGSALALLAGERAALNFLGHLSGIATLTRRYAETIAHTKAKICDTRKTAPGLRSLQKYAVKCGGGVNHRFGLYDAVLIKDNHIALAGSVAAALESARKNAPSGTDIEIEADTLEQLKEALQVGARKILLDNMSIGQLKAAVALNAGRALLEASGGVTLRTVRAIAETGVNMISCGALTHSAPNFDLSLQIVGE